MHNTINRRPEWLVEALEGRTVWEGREVFGTTQLRVIRQPGDPVEIDD